MGATREVLSVAWHAPTGTPQGAGWAGRAAGRLVVPPKPGDAGGGKEPGFESDAGGGIWKMPWCGVSAMHAKRRFVGRTTDPLRLGHADLSPQAHLPALGHGGRHAVAAMETQFSGGSNDVA